MITKELVRITIEGQKRLMDFINSLPKEPVEPEVECDDLKKAADDHIRRVTDAAGHPGWDWETQDIADAFKAGAEWQKKNIIATIESRLSEIIGDAQPNPILRIELQELIKKIEA